MEKWKLRTVSFKQVPDLVAVAKNLIGQLFERSCRMSSKGYLKFSIVANFVVRHTLHNLFCDMFCIIYFAINWSVSKRLGKTNKEIWNLDSEEWLMELDKNMP